VHVHAGCCRVNFTRTSRAGIAGFLIPDEGDKWQQNTCPRVPKPASIIGLTQSNNVLSKALTCMTGKKHDHANPFWQTV
jgi:hypothetical protein